MPNARNVVSNPRSTVSIAGHPIHPMLIPFPIAFFVTTFISDLAFQQTGNPFWAMASLWLLGAGLVMAGLAAVVGLIDVLSEPTHPGASRYVVACGWQYPRRAASALQLVS